MSYYEYENLNYVIVSSVLRRLLMSSIVLNNKNKQNKINQNTNQISLNMEYCKYKDSFCYICGHFITKNNVRKRNEKFVVWYRECYSDAEWIDEIYAPSVGCGSCFMALKRCNENEQKQTKYESPMTWNNPGDHNPNTCYFCMNIRAGLNTLKSK